MDVLASTSRCFDFHGVGIRVTCPLHRTGLAVSNLLDHFSIEGGAHPDIEIAIESTSDPEGVGDLLPPSASLLYSNRLLNRDASAGLGLEFDVYRTADGVFVDLGRKGMMIFQPDSARARILLADEESMHVDILGSLLLYTLSELLKPRGLHLLHAAAVSLDGRAVIIPGTQGRGKTTTCLALVSGGFGFLSDDVIFVREREGRVEACGVPEHVSVTDNTIAMFPAIQARASSLEPGLLKRHIGMERLFPGSTVSSAIPAVLLFPEVTGQPESRLEPMPRPRALEVLLPRGVSVLDRKDAAHSFQLLSRLAAQCACYRLAFGTRVGDVAPLLRRALASLP